MIPARTTPWQPLYKTLKFIGPLVENFIDVIKRDQVEALAWAKALLAVPGDAVLAPFRSVRNTDMRDTKYPWVIVEPERTATDEAEDGAAVKEDHRIAVELAITGKDPEQLTRTLVAYVLAIHMMLISASVKEVLAGYGPCMDVSWEVKEHEYSRSGQGEDDIAYVRAARMTVIVKFSEVQDE